jgi:hypothetical protein
MTSSAGGAGPLNGGTTLWLIASSFLSVWWQGESVFRVAGPGLGGEQVAVLRLHAASVVPRNRRSILLSKGSVCAPWHKTHRDTKGVPNFGELRKGEVQLRRILLQDWVNRVASDALRAYDKPLIQHPVLLDTWCFWTHGAFGH